MTKSRDLMSGPVGDEREGPQYPSTWAWLVSYALAALTVIGVAWAIAWAVVEVHGG